MSRRISMPNHLNYALLGLIRRKPLHGYEILQHWDDNLGIIWHVKTGALYAVLKKLEQAGLVESVMVAGDASPMRKVFSITPQGEEAFMVWMGEAVATAREFRQEFFAKLFFAQDVAPEMICRLFDVQITACNRWLEREKQLLHSGSPFEIQVHHFRVRQIQSMLEYLQDASKSIT